MAVGSVFVDVVPSTRGFVRKMAGDLEREGDSLGKALGQRIANGIGDNLGRQIAGNLPQLADFQRVSEAADRAGAQAGKKFSQSLINSARKLTADLRNLTDVQAVVSTRLEINQGALDEVQRDIYELGNSRINVDVDVDDAELNSIADDLFERERVLKIRVDADASALPGITKDLDVVRDKARDMPDIRFNADFKQIDDAGRAVDRLGAAATRSAREGQRLNTFQENALLATAAFTPASAAVLGFAAAGLAVIAPVAAIAAGVEGIKQSFAPLGGQLQQLRQDVSAVFIEGLGPAVGNISRLFPALNTGLSGTAGALSGVVVQMTGVAASSQSVGVLDRVFRNMNEAVTGLGPPMGKLVQNTLSFADIGASAMVTIGPILDEVGTAWSDMISTLQDSGLGEKAVVALVQVIGSLLTLAAPLVQLGAEMFAAIGPGLAAALNGTAAVVSFLANVFASLPGPVQTAIATMLILRAVLALTNKSMGGIAQQIGNLAGRANDSLTSPFRAASAAMSAYDARLAGTGQQLALFGAGATAAGEKTKDAGKKIADTATAGDKVAAAFQRGGEAIGGSYAAGTAKASKALDTVKTAQSAALTSVVSFGDKAHATMDRWADNTLRAVDKTEAAYRKIPGAPRAALASVVDFGQRAHEAMDRWGDNTLRAVDKVERGYNTLKAAPGQALDAIGSRLYDSQVQATQWAASSADATGKVRDNFSTLAAGPMRSIQALSTGMFQGTAGFTQYAAASETTTGRVRASFSTLSGANIMGSITALSTGMINGRQAFAGYAASSESAGARVRAAFSSLGGVVTQAMGNAGVAVVSGTARMTSALGQGVEAGVNKVGQGYIRLGEVVGRGMDGATRAVSTGASKINTGLTALSTAAGRAGTGLAAGFSKAISGITGALGGPWGAALTAAMVLLALFGDAMARNAQKQADFQQSVRQTADALRESGGAVTEQMRANELFTISQGAAGQAAKTLGVDITDLTNRAIDGGSGWDFLKERLTAASTAGQVMGYAAMESTVGLDAQQQAVIKNGEAADVLLGALGPLEQKYRDAAAANQAYEFALRNSGNSMVGGLGVTAQLTEAFSALQNVMSTTTEKATALQSALTLLAGGTLPAEQAQAALNVALNESGEAFKNVGANALDANGQINRTTEGGQKLLASFTGVSSALSTAATSTFEAAGGMNNVAAAGAAAAKVVSDGREQFVRQATAALGSAEAANRYADQVGLIPSLVTTLLTMTSTGIAQTQQELQMIQGLVQNPALKNTTITVTANDQTQAVLTQVGIKFERLPEGKIGIVANDQTAAGIASVISAINNLPPGKVAIDPQTGAIEPSVAAALTGIVPPVAPTVTPNTSQVGPLVNGAVAGANPPPVTVTPDADPIAPGIQSAVAGANPPPVNVGANTAPLTSDVNSATSGLPAAQVEVVLKNVQDIEATIGRIRQNLGQPITMTLNLVNNIGTAPTDIFNSAKDKTVTLTLALVNNVGTAATTAFNVNNKTATLTLALTDNVGTRPATAFAVNNKTATLTLALVDNIGTRPTTAFAVANKTATLTLALVDNVGSVPTEKFAIPSKTVTLTLALVDNIKNVPIERFSIAAKTVTLTLALTDNIKNIPTERFNQVTNKTVTLTLALVDNIGNRAREAFAIESKTVTLTTQYKTVGAPPPGNAAGNIYGNAKGGMYAGHSLTPMSAGVARKVQPNTWRVVGDRTSKPESYIPWNNSPRSRALLSTTAKAFGYALAPMANGGVGSADTLRLAQLARQKVGTQTVGAMTGVQGMSGTDAKAGKAQAVQLAEIATLLRAQQAQPRTITVEDRSGNPVETARKVVLAQRLAR